MQSIKTVAKKYEYKIQAKNQYPFKSIMNFISSSSSPVYFVCLLHLWIVI